MTFAGEYTGNHLALVENLKLMLILRRFDLSSIIIKAK